MHTCPLCQNQRTHHYFEDKRREYLQCEQCSLVFVNPDQRLDAESEKAHYDLHENNPDDLGYRRFLSRITDPNHRANFSTIKWYRLWLWSWPNALLDAGRGGAQHGVVQSLLPP